jgi:hypothetical protein
MELAELAAVLPLLVSTLVGLLLSLIDASGTVS